MKSPKKPQQSLPMVRRSPTGLPEVSRRQLFRLLGLAGAGIATTALVGCTSDAKPEAKKAGAKEPVGKKTESPKTEKNGKRASSSSKNAKGKVLVIVELQGGNDGFASLVPYGDANFRKRRDKIWIDPKELEMMDDRYAMAKGLAPIAKRLAFVEGVGVAKPDLSHFEMVMRWWEGDGGGSGRKDTGFLGRCCDLVHANESITGISLGGGTSPALSTKSASTVSLPQLDQIRELAKAEPSEEQLRRALAGLAHDGGKDSPLTQTARHNLSAGLDLLGEVTRLGEKPKSYPDGNDLGDALSMVRQLVSLDVGMQIFHIPWGSFDTHTNQNGTHTDHMNRFGAALAAFHADLDANNLGDRVLVATTSEFGRRPEANSGGTDHGTASTMMLTGPVVPGRHGVAPNFNKLDKDGNVQAGVMMADYYATLADWIGVPVDEVVDKGGKPIDGLLKT